MKRVLFFSCLFALAAVATNLFAQEQGAVPKQDRSSAQTGNQDAPRGGQGEGQQGQSNATKPKAVSIKEGVAVLSPENTRVNFVGTHNGDEPKPRLGGFKKFTGSLKMNESGDGIESLTMQFETNSLWTELGGRLTDHLKNSDFLDVEKFPTAKFASNSVMAGEKAGMFNVVGDFTLMGKTNEITIPLTLKREEAGVLAKGEVVLDRSEFGMNKMLEGVSKLVTVTLSVGEKTLGDTPEPKR
jgi:polyisoprenoid-binding protein YceI